MRLCGCGQTVLIPSLSKLRSQFRVEAKSDNQITDRKAFDIAVVVALILLLAVWIWNPHSWTFSISMLLIFCGKAWFVAVMFQEMGGRAIIFFIIPCLDWIFLIQRFDVAWRPVVLQAAGIALLLISGM
jgi:hypothetical protein